MLFTGLVMLALTLALAEILLSVCLDFAGADFRAGEPLAGPAAFSGMAAARRLAAGDFAVARRADLRVFLGDVELLVVAAMDLPHAGRADFCTSSKCRCWVTAVTFRSRWSCSR